MAEQKQIEWPKVEADYRAGVKSLRQIAADRGLSEGAIRKRAKKEDWERDLAEKVRSKAEALVRKEAVRSEVREQRRVPESVVVEDNANLMATVMLSERRDIQRSRTLAMTLLEEVEDQTMRRELYENLGALMANPDENGRDKLNDLYMKVIGSSGRIDNMKKLADTLKTLVAMEREAYGIGSDDKGKAGTYEDFIDSL